MLPPQNPARRSTVQRHWLYQGRRIQGGMGAIPPPPLKLVYYKNVVAVRGVFTTIWRLFLLKVSKFFLFLRETLISIWLKLLNLYFRIFRFYTPLFGINRSKSFCLKKPSFKVCIPIISDLPSAMPLTVLRRYQLEKIQPVQYYLKTNK